MFEFACDAGTANHEWCDIPDPGGYVGTECVRCGLYWDKSDKSDPVNKPKHYRWLPVEAIEITELFNFNLGNALKYIIRADHKGKPIEDLEKARWYLDRELQRRAKQ